MRKLLFGVILIIAFTSVASAQEPSAATRTAIEANNKTLVEALNKGDAAGVAALYTADAKLLPPESAMVEGRVNIQAFWAGAIKAGLKLVSLTPIDLDTSGSVVIETGKYVSTAPVAGSTVTDEGKYLVIWKRQGRGWRIVRDIFNSDKPTP